MILTIILTVTILFCGTAAATSTTSSHSAVSSNATSKLGNVQVPFVENQGQLNNSKVKYYVATISGNAYITYDGITYILLNNSHAVKEHFVGSNNVSVKGTNKSKTIVNYFKGNDKNKWKKNISTYNQLYYADLYPNIDLTLKAYGKNFEKIFKVKPSGDPNDIRFLIEGANSLKINKKGELEIVTNDGILKMTAPIAYQIINGKRVNVSVNYFVNGSYYGFKVGNYNKAYDMTIDPLLASTFLGGSDSDTSKAVSMDSHGNIFVTGTTQSYDLPVTSGAYDASFNGYYDIFVSKFNSDLTQLLAFTYLGGIKYDGVSSLAVDSLGNVFITGSTQSINFPVTSGAYDTTFDNNAPYPDNAFVLKLNNDLTTLLASTFIGGNSDTGQDIAIDSAGNIFVTGSTATTNFPVTPGAYDASYNGGDYDIFVSKFNSDLTQLLASTYLGGTDMDIANGITVDPSGKVFIAGFTNSSNFPVTTGAYNTAYNGKTLFISKLDNNLFGVLASTFIGGNSVTDIIVSSVSGNIFVSGYTNSTSFPVTSGAYDTSYNGGTYDIFVSKFSSNLTQLLASTYLGGNDYDIVYGMDIDPLENIFIVGGTSSTNFPTTPGAYDKSFNGDGDQFSRSIPGDVIISKLNSNLTQLLASTYLGGNYGDVGYAIAVDPSGNIIITGRAGSTNFPATLGAYDESLNGAGDVFISKFTNDLKGTADINVTISADDKNPKYKQTVLFVVTAKNNGPNDASGVTVEYVVPPGLSDVIVTPSEGTSYSNGVWTIGNLSSGASAFLKIMGIINVSNTSIISNAAKTELNEFDPDLGNDASSLTLNIPKAVSVAVTTAVNNATPKYSQNIVYTVKVVNNGPDDATGLQITDLLPAGIRYVSDTSGGLYNYLTGIWDIGDLASGESKTLNITGNVTKTGVIVNAAQKTSVTEYDTDGNDDSSSTSIVVPAAADIKVKKTVDNATPKYLQNVKFTINVTNNGPNIASGVKITDILPEGIQIVSLSTNQGTYSSGIWNVGTLANGTTATLTVIGKITASNTELTSTVIKTAQNEYDQNTGNDASSVTLTVPAAADLNVKKIINGEINYLQNVGYTIHVENNGPNNATGVKIVDEIPDGFDFVSAETSQGTYDPLTGIWDIGNISAGNDVFAQITVKARELGSFSGTAAASGAEYDPNSLDNAVNSQMDVKLKAAADVKSGSYNQTKVVNITSNKEGAVIYYTTDGSDPTETSNIYTGPIYINSQGTTILKFIAADGAGNWSEINTETYAIDTTAPKVWADHKGGLYNKGITVALESDDENADIYYRINGGDEQLYSDPIIIDSEGTTELTYRAVDESGNCADTLLETYTIDLPPEVWDNTEGGLFNHTINISLESNDGKAKIYYTLNGTNPKLYGKLYTGPISIGAEGTNELSYAAVDESGNWSDIYAESYIIDTTAPELWADPEGGIYSDIISVTLNSDDNVDIYYTLDGSDPRIYGQLYTDPIEISDEGHTVLKYVAVDDAGNLSGIYTELYTIDTTAPDVWQNVDEGLYNHNVTLTLESDDEEADIYYTFDDWKTSHRYTNPITLTDGKTKIIYFAIDPAGNLSDDYIGYFTIDTKPPVTSANIKGGLYNATKTITLSMNEPGKIYYTLDGTVPTSKSKLYTGPIKISSTTTLRFIAIDTAGNPSSVYTEKYTIDKVTPKVVSTSPKNGATGVSRTATFAIKLSESVKNSTNWSKIYVKNLSTGKIVSITKWISGNMLYINTTSRRLSYTWYRIYIPSAAVKDYAGNNAGSYTLQFKTGR